VVEPALRWAEATFKTRFTAEARRSRRKVFPDPIPPMADWIRNISSSGLRSESLHGSGSGQKIYPERTVAFLFGAISPPNKKDLLCASAVKDLFWSSWKEGVEVLRMGKLYEFICKNEIFAAQCALGILSLLVFAAAVGRFLYYPLNWAMDVATFLFAWTVFLGADAAMRLDRLFCIEVITG